MRVAPGETRGRGLKLLHVYAFIALPGCSARRDARAGVETCIELLLHRALMVAPGETRGRGLKLIWRGRVVERRRSAWRDARAGVETTRTGWPAAAPQRSARRDARAGVETRFSMRKGKSAAG